MTNEEPTAAPTPTPPQRPSQAASPQIPPIDGASPQAPPPQVAPPVHGAPPQAAPSAANPQLPPAQQIPSAQTPGAQQVPGQVGPPGFGQNSALGGEPPLMDNGGYGAISSPTQSVKKSNTGMRVGLAGALLGVTALGGFAVKTALSEPAGPETPEEAMEAWFEALENEDVIGMAETLLPAEREALIDPIFALADEAERLEIFGAGTEIDSLGTIDIKIEGLEVKSTPLAEGFATVESSAGTISVSGTTDDIPIAEVIADWTGTDPESIDDAADLATDPVELVAVEKDGIWYLSLTYSVAEVWREDAAEPLPNFGAGPSPVGGSTPEAAVEAFMSEVVDLDLNGMLTQLDPEEMAALYDYSPLFLPEAQDELDGLKRELDDYGLEWSLTDLALRSEDSRGRTLVFVDGFTLEGFFGGDSARIELADGCYTIRVESEYTDDIDETVCDGVGDTSFTDTPELPELQELQELIEGIEFPETGVTVVQRGDSWYISSAPTFTYMFVDVLKALQPSDIERFKELGPDLFDDYLGSSLGGMLSPIAGEESFYEIDDEIEFDFEEESGFSSDGGTGSITGQGFESVAPEEYVYEEVDAAFVPGGVEAYVEELDSWGMFDTASLTQPASAFSVYTDDSWVSVAEYASADQAMESMDSVVSGVFEGDQDIATFDVFFIYRSGRFLVIVWDEDSKPLASEMVIHLADQ